MSSVNLRKSLFVVLLAVVFTVSMSPMAHAAELPEVAESNSVRTVKESLGDCSKTGGDILVECKNDDICVVESGRKSTIHVTENEKNVKVSVWDETNKTGYYFSRDKMSGDIYSSITGRTISSKEIEQDGDAFVQKTGNGQWKKQVSYKTIAKALGTTTSYAALISWSMVFVGFSLVAANVTTGISGMMLIINTYLPKKSAKHGLEFTMRHKRIKKHQGGSVVYVTVNEACGCKRY